MALHSRQIDWVFLGPLDCPQVRPGDVISADAGVLPTYEVMAVTDGRAWLRNLEDGSDRVAPLTAFHWKAQA